MRLVEELAEKNIKQFIVTTSGRDSLNPFLETSLRSHVELFSRIITYEDVRNHKPYPDAYKLAIKLSKQSHVNCLAIEDSSIGIQAAKAANLNCLLTLPPWKSSLNTISKRANACLDSLGNEKNISKLIYGKPLLKKYVDVDYLTSIIN